jgi:hypothetical protein
MCRGMRMVGSARVGCATPGYDALSAGIDGLSTARMVQATCHGISPPDLHHHHAYLVKPSMQTLTDGSSLTPIRVGTS